MISLGDPPVVHGTAPGFPPETRRYLGRQTHDSAASIDQEHPLCERGADQMPAPANANAELAAGKLLIILNAMLKHGTEWQPSAAQTA